MRRVSKFAAVAAAASMLVAAAGCTVPPGSDPGGPMDCTAGPVDLGVGDDVEQISADGRTIVLTDYPDDETEGVSYTTVDRATGARREFLRASPLGDGATIHLDAAGHRALTLQYPELPDGVVPWNLIDLRTGISEPVEPGIGSDRYVIAVSSTLDRAVVEDWDVPGRPWSIVDTTTGDVLAALPSAPAGWTNGVFSRDLTHYVQRSTGTTAPSFRVVSVATGQVVRDIGRFRGESTPMGVGLEFLDADTILIGSVEPFDAPWDGIPDDGAVIVKISTGVITRLDPGVPGAIHLSASSDGRRSSFMVINTSGRWLSVDGTTRPIDQAMQIAPDHSYGVTIDDGRAVLNCL